MLRLIIGKAGSGKTGMIISEIAQRVKCRNGLNIMIVPEQYSHEAEKELCRACGDTMSLFAEVFSFTGLARRIMSQQGGNAKPYLDKGGRMLCMALALDMIGPKLKVYSSTRKKAQLQAVLLKEVDELKAACVSSEMLRNAAVECDSVLGGKLNDMAEVLEAYDAVVNNGHADPTDRLTVLAGLIPKSGINGNTRIYLDGFSDFTGQEYAVIKALIDTGADVTLCLTLDKMNSESEVYGITSRTAGKLAAYAKEKGIVCSVVDNEDDGKNRGISFFADNMFSYSSVQFKGDSIPVSVNSAETMADECEFAAAQCLKLVRDEGCRWRDIAVAVRGFEDYREILESCFDHYGVPVFTARKSELAAKPLPALVACLYELLDNGWEVDDLISYLHTGLTGLNQEECDILENYVFLWQIKGSAWKRAEDWHQHPDGYKSDYSDEVKNRLEEINALRRRIAFPVIRFEETSAHASSAAAHAAALVQYFDDIGLPDILEKRSASLLEQGRGEQAAEYSQLWDIICGAVEQCAAILGNTEMTTTEFGQLFMTVLSKYDVGTIPVSLDSVTAGDFDRMRRRNIRHLIVLGATDSRIPKAQDNGGVFSDDDRQRLLELDVNIGGAGEEELWREFNLVYNTVTLPSQSIIFTKPSTNADGAAESFSIICRRAMALFGIKDTPVDMTDCRLNAVEPALGIAADGIRNPGTASVTAAEYFRQNQQERFEEISSAAQMKRGSLTPEAAKQLYGGKLKLSASKIDTLAACKFEYFCRYGLEAKRHEPMGFQPPEIGTFFHAVLEKTAIDVKAAGGWKNVTDEQLESLTDKYIGEYVNSEMDGLKEKTPRFIYLFNRMRNEVLQIVLDMAGELRKSDFEPIEFEFNFDKQQDIAPIELGDGMGSMKLTGIADRIDGWKCGDTLYIRVVDYKTGEKKFELSDIWYGAGLQMLLYLYTLENNAARFGVSRIVPAGVMYVPAKVSMITKDNNVTDEQISQDRLGKIRRSGIVLSEDQVFEAWENGEDKKYIPVKFSKKENIPDKEKVASREQFGLMYRHIVRTLTKMAVELHEGKITADPLCRSEKEGACSKCDFASVCNFRDGENGESIRIKKKYDADEVWEMMKGEENDG